MCRGKGRNCEAGFLISLVGLGNWKRGSREFYGVVNTALGVYIYFTLITYPSTLLTISPIFETLHITFVLSWSFEEFIALSKLPWSFYRTGHV